MNTKIAARVHGMAWRAAAACIASTALMPTVALAEEERSGIQLLIPAIGELIPACIAFAIIFAVMSKMVWPTVVKMMADREEALNAQFVAAEDARAQSDQIIADAQARLDEAHREAEQVISDARRKAEEERGRILEEAQGQAADIIAKGHKAVMAERDRAMGELSKSVAELSVEIAGRIIAADLNDQQHLELAERFLDEMGLADGNQ